MLNLLLDTSMSFAMMRLVSTVMGGAVELACLASAQAWWALLWVGRIRPVGVGFVGVHAGMSLGLGLDLWFAVGPVWRGGLHDVPHLPGVAEGIGVGQLSQGERLQWGVPSYLDVDAVVDLQGGS